MVGVLLLAVLLGAAQLTVATPVTPEQPHHSLQHETIIGPDRECAQIDFVCHGKPHIATAGESFQTIATQFECKTEDIRVGNPHITTKDFSHCDELCIPLQEGECFGPEYEAVHSKEKEEALNPMELIESQSISTRIIPRPQSIEMLEGSFILSAATKIIACDDAILVANQLASTLRTATGFPFLVEIDEKWTATNHLEEEMLLATGTNDSSTQTEIKLTIDIAMPEEEGYTIDVDTNTITIQAPTTTGLFYAVQTLRQLLPAEIESLSVVPNTTWEIPRCKIEDFPSYKWRGIMLDVSRHFFTVNEVKHLLNMMAMHKMNIFHWHLTDDHGWRLPIPGHPEIAEQGGWREVDATQPDLVYGGSYSPTDIMEVVLHARSLHIEVVPEIDMPGHSQTLLISHPEVGNLIDKAVRAMDEWGVSQYTLDPTKQTTFLLVDSLIGALVSYFPSDYIHVGGDEADQTQWKQNPNVTQLIEKLHLTSYDQVQGYFERAVNEILKRKNKRMIGWDEMLRGGLPKDVIVMSWEGTQPGVEAAQLGHDVVMCPMSNAYFDRKYDDFEERGRLGVMPLRDTYDWDPRSVPGLTDELAPRILGAQGNIWTEGMITIDDVEYLSMPRMSALSEVVWTKKHTRHFPDFVGRIQEMSKRMQIMGVQYPLLQYAPETHA